MQHARKVGRPSNQNPRKNLYSRSVNEIVQAGLIFIRMLRVQLGDVFVISSPSYLYALACSYAARIRKVPYILEIRDIYPEVYISAGLISESSLWSKLLKCLTAKMYRESKGVIVPTQGLKRNIESYKPCVPVKLIYNGFLRPTVNVEKRLNFSAVFHGNLGFFQDVDSLIRLANELQKHDVELHVVGFGPKVDEVKRSKNIVFHKKMSHEKTLRFVSSCHVGISLRFDDDISKDAFPVKIWEYIGLGLPVITTPISEGGQFLVDNGLGFQFGPGEIADITQCIVNMKENGWKSEVKLDDFSREKTGQKILDFIEKLMDE